MSKLTGGKASYYQVTVKGVELDANDLIDALSLDWNQANVFKSIWRDGKKGNTHVYEAEKCVFYSKRMLQKAERGVNESTE